MKASPLFIKRRSLGIVQSDIAERLKVHTETVRDLERDTLEITEETYKIWDNAIDEIAKTKKPHSKVTR